MTPEWVEASDEEGFKYSRGYFDNGVLSIRGYVCLTPTDDEGHSWYWEVIIEELLGIMTTPLEYGKTATAEEAKTKADACVQEFAKELIEVQCK